MKELKEDKFRIAKSRYDSTDCYIYPCSKGYNDIPLQYSEVSTRTPSQHRERILSTSFTTSRGLGAGPYTGGGQGGLGPPVVENWALAPSRR